MAPVYERAFRVRHYECDVYGHVNHANYLRYLQEAALEALAVCGIAPPNGSGGGPHWRVRETDISYLRPLTYGDTVLVQTWLDGYEWARTRRVFELRNAETRATVATAVCIWEHLDGETRAPTPLPQTVVDTFWPDGVPQTRLTELSFPVAPSPPPGVFRMRRDVAWRDVDLGQSLNHATLLRYLEDCGTAVLIDRGWPMQRMLKQGFGVIARRYRLQYRAAAAMGDELEIATWSSDVRRATAVRHYTITRPADGKLLLRAHSLWVWLNLENARPIRIPPDFAGDFADHVAAPVAGQPPARAVIWGA